MPPRRGGSRNLIIAIVAVVVVAAAAIIAIVALSGGDDTKPAAQPTATLTGSPVRPSSSVATSTGASTGPSAGAVSCADIAGTSLLNGKLTLTPGGSKPDVQLPAGAPDLICSGETHVNQSAHVTALAWHGVSQSSYLGQLTRAGWTDNTATPPFHVLVEQGAKYQIVTVEIKGSLVAIFGPA
jgi:hypothetical protein